MPVILSEQFYSSAPSASIHSIINNDRNKYVSGCDPLRLYRNYVEGKQQQTLTIGQREILREVIGHEFADNVCLQIIAEAADRLNMIRWTCEDKKVQEFLDALFITSSVEDFAGEIHFNMIQDGNHVVALGWDQEAQRVTLHSEPWWDEREGVFIAYDDLRQPKYGVKEWYPGYDEDGNPNDNLKRRNIWFKGRLERYISPGGGSEWIPYSLPEDNGQWPLPWKKADGSDMAIPYVHFINSGKTVRGAYGRSDLAGGVLGFQDQINDLQYAITAAARMTAYQMYTAAGIEPKKDAKGDDLPPEVGPGRLLWSSNPDAKFGRIPAGDLNPLLSAYGTKQRRVAQMTRTPFHVISGGDWPSADALRIAERPAVQKANRNVRKGRVKWSEVAHRATEISNAFSKDQTLEEDVVKAPIVSEFGPTERVEFGDMAQTIQQLGGFISRREGLRKMGYSESSVEKIIAEKIKETTEFQSAQIARNQSQFDNRNRFGQQNEQGTGPDPGAINKNL